jgi:hypothetical protein
VDSRIKRMISAEIKIPIYNYLPSGDIIYHLQLGILSTIYPVGRNPHAGRQSDTDLHRMETKEELDFETIILF